MKLSFLGKQIPFLTKFFFFVFAVLVSYAIIAQTILIPRAISGQYDQVLNPDFKQVREKFNAISKSTEAAAYNDPYADPSVSRKELLQSRKLIAETELTLQNYEERANTLPSSPLAPLSGSYKKAEIIRERAQAVFLQSREVLNGYKQLTAYLLQANAAQTVLKNNTADINSLRDLNQLAGQGDVIAKRAAQVDETVKNLKANEEIPAGYGDYNAAFIASLEQVSTGLRQLSQGLIAASDAQINASAKVIEQAVLKHETDDNVLYSAASTNSATLKETSMIADKIDSLQPFMDQ